MISVTGQTFVTLQLCLSLDLKNLFDVAEQDVG